MTQKISTAALADDSVTQAKVATGVAGEGPAFSAKQTGSQSISSGSPVVLTFDSEDFDTASCFDTGTGRFTPTVAGYYQVNLNVQYLGTTYSGFFSVFVYKNGSSYVEQATPSGTQYVSGSVPALIYMNGTTDYIDARATQNFGSSQFVQAKRFSASLARAA